MKLDRDILLKIAFPIIIIMGLAKTTSYYHHFNVPILEYLGLQEITIIFLNNIYMYLTLSIYIIILFFVKDDFFRARMALIFIALLLVLISYYYSGYNLSDFTSPTRSIVLVSPILLIIFLFTYKSLANYFRIMESCDKRSMLLIYCSLYLLLFSTFQGYHEGKLVRKKGLFSGTSIKFKNQKEITSNDSIMYIGKSNNYVFFYNKAENSAEIYPVNDIEKINYKRKAGY